MIFLPPWHVILSMLRRIQLVQVALDRELKKDVMWKVGLTQVCAICSLVAI